MALWQQYRMLGRAHVFVLASAAIGRPTSAKTGSHFKQRRFAGEPADFWRTDSTHTAMELTT